jgi:hypothetical protein
MIREFVDDEVIIEGGTAVGVNVGALTYDWPSENSPAWWRQKLESNPSLQEEVRRDFARFRMNPGNIARRSAQEQAGKEYLTLLMAWEKALKRPKTPPSAKAKYIAFAAPFYGNAYPLDAKSGLPVRPAGTEGVAGLDEMFGGPMSNAIQAHEFDGLALGYSLSVVESARQGVELGNAPDVGIVILIARIGVGAVGIGVSLSGIAFANANKGEAAAAFAAAFN